jgi:hypothetical protein
MKKAIKGIRKPWLYSSDCQLVARLKKMGRDVANKRRKAPVAKHNGRDFRKA